MEKNEMSYKDFRDKVLDKLEKYKNDVLGIKEKGIFRYKGEDKPEGHILPTCQGESKKSMAKKYNVLNCLKDEEFLINENDLHRYAHHLNSSQLMCYNFFRPYIEVEEDKIRPNKILIDLLRKYNIAINQYDDAICQFEYVQQDSEYNGEGTNFDFYLKSGETEVFFEIKFTEAGFGKCDCDEKHKNKFGTIYKTLIKGCPAIKKPITYGKEFCRNYQLFRNSIRTKDNNKYVIFIYDENNSYCKKQLQEFFDNYIKDEYKNNIIGITWQNIVEKSESPYKDEFIEKYLSYKK